MTRARRRYAELLDSMYRARAAARGPLSMDEEYKYTQALVDLWHQLDDAERREIECLGDAYGRALDAKPRPRKRALHRRFGAGDRPDLTRPQRTALAWLAREAPLSIELWGERVSPRVSATLSVAGLITIEGGVVKLAMSTENVRHAV